MSDGQDRLSTAPAYKRQMVAAKQVSVVIPCFNAGNVVEEAVRSVLTQTLTPVDVICVDDGSTDHTLGVLQRVAAAYPGRVAVVSQRKAGACAARNRGLHLARGAYVQFLDADDILLPHKLEHQMALAEAQGMPDLIAGSYVRHRLDGRRRPFIMQSMNPWAALPQVMLGITSANLFNRQAVLDAGGWNEHYTSSQEYELMFRMLKCGCRVAYDRDALTIIRQQPRSITASNRHANMLRRIELGADIREYVRHHVGSSDALTAADAGLFHVIHLLCSFDLRQGVETFYRHFDDGDHEHVRAKSSRTYTYFYRMLGFRKTEQLRIAMWKLLRRARGMD